MSNAMSERPVVILAAVLPEVRPLIERWGLSRVDGEAGEHVYEGETPVGRVVLRIMGVGPSIAKATANAMIEAHEPRLVVCIGLAGALSRALGAGDLVVPERVIDSVTGGVFERPTSSWSSGCLLTIDRIVTRPEDKAALHARFEAAAVDMESAAVAKACEGRGVAWLCVRAISDTADQRLPAKVGRLVNADGTPNLGRAIGHALTHPHDLRALVRLGRHTRRAAAALADALPGLIKQALR